MIRIKNLGSYLNAPIDQRKGEAGHDKIDHEGYNGVAGQQ
jgi:hypothetical protein